MWWLLVLVLAVPARAEDTAAVAAALKDAPAECRYLTTLCQRWQRVTARPAETLADAYAKRDALVALKKAEDVVQAKRGGFPKCYKGCD